jgi:hypothetical protein
LANRRDVADIYLTTDLATAGARNDVDAIALPALGTFGGSQYPDPPNSCDRSYSSRRSARDSESSLLDGNALI